MEESRGGNVVIARNRIHIREKGPQSTTHIVEFGTPQDARKAFKRALEFWKNTGRAAFLVESQLISVGVSTDVIASVSLFTVKEEKKQAKKKTKAKK